MKFSIILSIFSLISCLYSAPINSFDNSHQQLICISKTLDQLVVDYDCEIIWDRYRQEFSKFIIDYENCNELESDMEIDELISLNTTSIQENYRENESDTDSSILWYPQEEFSCINF